MVKKNKITLFKDTASLSGDNSIKLLNSGESISSKNVIIATGARPRNLPNLEIDGEMIISSREALELKKLPKSIGIIGAGAIGVEFAYLFNAYGVEVKMFEAQSNLVPNEDKSISSELEKIFSSKGITFELNSTVSGTSVSENTINVEYDSSGEKKNYSCEKLLVAVGVQSNVDGIGLEEAGVELENNFIKIDDYMKTSNPNIYAVGDVTGKLMLAHVAFSQGVIAAETIAGHDPNPINYVDMPRCTYCQPQIASLGLTEDQAKEQGYDVKISQFPFKAVGKAISIGDSEGFVKLVADNESGELLGAHIVGSEATEMIAELGMAKALESTWEDLSMTVHAHPTLSEAIMEAAMDAQGHSIHQ